jgi:hypothetical protein
MMRKPNLISTTSAGQSIALERWHRHPPTPRETVIPPYFVRLTALLSVEQHPILVDLEMGFEIDSETCGLRRREGDRCL